MYIQHILFSEEQGLAFLTTKPFRKAVQGLCAEVSSFLQPDNQAASSHLRVEHLLLSNWGGNFGAYTTLATLLANLSQTQLLSASNPFHKGRRLM